MLVSMVWVSRPFQTRNNGGKDGDCEAFVGIEMSLYNALDT